MQNKKTVKSIKTNTSKSKGKKYQLNKVQRKEVVR